MRAKDRSSNGLTTDGDDSNEIARFQALSVADDPVRNGKWRKVKNSKNNKRISGESDSRWKRLTLKLRRNVNTQAT